LSFSGLIWLVLCLPPYFLGDRVGVTSLSFFLSAQSQGDSSKTGQLLHLTDTGFSVSLSPLTAKEHAYVCQYDTHQPLAKTS
ncbi:MAG: hypothetical protein RR753_01755, partial [Raoultibacter sp.]